MKKFNNVENVEHKLPNGKVVWESRSIAVSGTIILKMDDNFFVLGAKRGKKAADYQGYWNLICGYLDWNETLSEAIEREIWEEVGFDLNITKKFLLVDKLNETWRIDDDPIKSNRQNITHHFGGIFVSDKFPELVIDGKETEDALWINIEAIDEYNWAFDHDKIIKLFVKKFIK